MSTMIGWNSKKGIDKLMKQNQYCGGISGGDIKVVKILNPLN